MRIHHLSCGTFCPIGGRLMDGRSDGSYGRLACHCLLVEADQGLVLVDTGLGIGDVRAPFPRLSRLYISMLGVRLDERTTALRQIEKMGFAAADVRHIVLTHLDFDHAGGITDFPQARVHLLADEAHCADERHGFVGRRRYRPAQWSDRGRWQLYAPPDGEPWLGFDAVRRLNGLPPEILMISLPGHTLGHAGVAIRDAAGWLLLAGDAYFFHGELEAQRYCPPGLRAYQRLMEMNG